MDRRVKPGGDEEKSSPRKMDHRAARFALAR
jgi:hypothetical protein